MRSTGGQRAGSCPASTTFPHQRQLEFPIRIDPQFP